MRLGCLYCGGPLPEGEGIHQCSELRDRLFRKQGEAVVSAKEKVIRFGTGATRSAETAFDPEGFISPAVLAEYSRYMAEHRVQADGELRASDNWAKGMPTSRAWRSLTRHFLDAWLIKRGYPAVSPDCTTLRGALCGILFNTMLLMKNIVIDKNDHEPDEGPVYLQDIHTGEITWIKK